jgi:periplasmic protein TonB
MDERPDAERVRSGAVGHVSVHLDDIHPPEVSFLFEQQRSRASGAGVVSFVFHAIAIIAVIFAPLWLPTPDPIDMRQLVESPNRIVFLNTPGPGGGGGGGGNKSPMPPRQVEAPGKDKLTVPVTKPPDVQPVPSPEDSLPMPELLIPAKQMASAEQSLAGMLDGLNSSSQGSGSGGGSGTGRGTGMGSGTGSGFGPGYGGGFGGGAYRPGSGIENPRLLREVRPQYTADAMRAKIQGTAVLDCVVNTDGSVGECEIARSLDSSFGLDQEAVKAAKQWRFVPGRRLGQPVPVLVTIEMLFTLR